VTKQKTANPTTRTGNYSDKGTKIEFLSIERIQLRDVQTDPFF